MTVIKELPSQLVRKIKDRADCDNLWVDNKNILYNSKGYIEGKIDHNNSKIKLFVIKE